MARREAGGPRRIFCVFGLLRLFDQALLKEEEEGLLLDRRAGHVSARVTGDGGGLQVKALAL
jgi:hypothetical protein